MAYKHIKRNCKSLIVCFSSRGKKSFDLYEQLIEIEDHDLLFLSDEIDGFYNFSIPDFSLNLSESIGKIKQLISGYEYSIALGAAMGGYAAIMFGIRCSFNKVVAVCPQITLNPNYTLTTKKTCIYTDLNELIVENNKTKVDIFYGNHIEDIIQISKLSNCNLHYIDSNLHSFGHNVLAELKDNDCLNEFILDVLDDKQSRYVSEFNYPLFSIDLLTNFYDFFLKKDYKQASSIAKSLLHRFRNPHLMYLTLTCYFATNDTRELSNIIEHYPEKYKGFESYNLMYLAVNIYMHGVDKFIHLINKSNINIIIMLLSTSSKMDRNLLDLRLFYKDNSNEGKHYSNYYHIAALYKKAGKNHDAMAYFLLAHKLSDKSSWMKEMSLKHAESLMQS